MSYPFLPKIKELLDTQGKTMVWLGDELQVTPRNIYNMTDIKKVTLNNILELSRALGFDFLKDYNEWLQYHGEPAISEANEPPLKYEKQKGITVQLSIAGGYNTFGLHFGELLKTIQKEGEKYGFSIES